jgi:hypothetical protein
MKKLITLAALALTLLAIPMASADAATFGRVRHSRPTFRAHYRTHYRSARAHRGPIFAPFWRGWRAR